MKKIVFAVGDLRMGGTQRVQSVIANELLLSGHDVKFFSLRKAKSYFKFFAEIVYPKHAVNFLKFIFILYSTGFKKIVLKKTVDMMVVPTQAIVDELIDYVKVNDIETVILVEQWLLVGDEVKASLPKVKIIGWIHLNAQIYESFLFKKSFNKLILGYQACDHLLALTYEDQEHIARYTKNNVRVMHNPLAIGKQNRKSNLNSKIISFVSRIDIHTKGLDYLIEVAKQLEEGWQIHIAGRGRKLEELRFRRMIQKNHLHDKIVWKGPKEGEEIVQHYLKSAIFIALSRFEGLPLVLTEAMSFGLPILAFANSGSREVTENGRYGMLARQGDIKQFCEQLSSLINSKKKREKYQQLSLKRIEFFNLEDTICRWEEII